MSVMYIRGTDGKLYPIETIRGPQGPTGPAPVKGVDYWTDADQEAIVQQVITALGTPVFGTVDAENNIILTGELAEGTYTLKYEDVDGNLTEIGSVTVGDDSTEVAYTNRIPLSTEYDGVTPYNNGLGYKENTRYSASGGGDVAADGIYITGYIPVSDGDIIRIKNVTMNQNSTLGNSRHVSYFTSASGETGASVDMYTGDTEKWSPIFDDGGNLVQFTVPSWGMVYIRLNATYIGEDSIVTINEEIPD